MGKIDIDIVQGKNLNSINVDFNTLILLMRPYITVCPMRSHVQVRLSACMHPPAYVAFVCITACCLPFCLFIAWVVFVSVHLCVNSCLCVRVQAYVRACVCASVRVRARRSFVCMRVHAWVCARVCGWMCLRMCVPVCVSVWPVCACARLSACACMRVSIT